MNDEDDKINIFINNENVQINKKDTLFDIRQRKKIEYTKYFLDKDNQLIDINQEKNKLVIDCLKNNNILNLKIDLNHSIILFNDYNNQNVQKIENKNYILTNKSNNERQIIYSMNENEKLSEIRKKGNFSNNKIFLDKNLEKIFIGSEENITIDNISIKINNENVIYYYDLEKYYIYYNKSYFKEIDNSYDINKTNLSQLRKIINLYDKARFIRVNNEIINLEEEKFIPIAEVLNYNCIHARLIKEDNLINNKSKNTINNNYNNNYENNNVINIKNYKKDSFKNIQNNKENMNNNENNINNNDKINNYNNKIYNNNQELNLFEKK